MSKLSVHCEKPHFLYNGKKTYMTQAEAELLALLAKNKDKFVKVTINPAGIYGRISNLRSYLPPNFLIIADGKKACHYKLVELKVANEDDE